MYCVYAYKKCIHHKLGKNLFRVWFAYFSDAYMAYRNELNDPGNGCVVLYRVTNGSDFVLFTLVTR